MSSFDCHLGRDALREPSQLMVRRHLPQQSHLPQTSLPLSLQSSPRPQPKVSLGMRLEHQEIVHVAFRDVTHRNHRARAACDDLLLPSLNPALRDQPQASLPQVREEVWGAQSHRENSRASQRLAESIVHPQDFLGSKSAWRTNSATSGCNPWFALLVSKLGVLFDELSKDRPRCLFLARFEVI